MLTQEGLKELLHYDPDTGIFTWLDSRSGSVKVGGVAGTTLTSRGKKYRRIGINCKQYKAHRLAFLDMTGKFPVNEVDHLSGNGLDNRWSNLRDVTHKENQRNQRLNSNNTTDFTGVYWSRWCNKWQAQITIDGRSKHLGYFAYKQDAVTVREAANIEYGFNTNHGMARHF